MVNKFENKENKENKFNDSRSEIDDLPDEIDEGDELDDLPDEIDEGDELDDLPDEIDEGNELDDEICNEINRSISTKEGIEEIISKHPEKREVIEKYIEKIHESSDIINNPDSTPMEIRAAQEVLKSNFNHLKGELLETATKDALSKLGLDVETKQKVIEGESGNTKPDVVARNNTDKTITAFGIEISPGEVISIECKCGSSSYINNQLKEHIPNQLSGHEGIKILMTTSDINNVNPDRVAEVCEKYGAKLVVMNSGVNDVNNAVREVCKI